MKLRTGVLIGAGTAAALATAREYWAASHEDSLSGEVALITGGSRGLGLALAREFARIGCRIAICARDEAELAAAAAELRARGADVEFWVCDVGDPEQVDGLIPAVTRRFGRIDILVNNAGIIQAGPAETFNLEDFEDAMRADFWGVVHPILAVLPQMLERKRGRIVNISSIGGKVGIPHLLPYTAAKFAVAGLSQGLASEMSSKGIHVTGIYPGLMRTGSFVQAYFKGDQKAEARWFTLSSSLPGMAISAERAAREIVTAVKRRRRDKTISMQARALAIWNGVFPAGVSDVLGLAAKLLLPAAPADSAVAEPPAQGKTLWDAMHPAIKALSTLGVRAMREYNQGI